MTMTPGTPRGDGGKGKGVGGRVGAPGAPLPRLLTGLDQPWPPAGGSVARPGAHGAPRNPNLRPDALPTSDAETSEYSYTEPTPDSEQ